MIPDATRSRPSPAMVVALIALFVAISGTAIALPGKNTVNSGDIKDNNVKSKDIKDGNVASIDILDGTVQSGDVANESLTGADILNGEVASAEVQNQSLTGADIGPDAVSSGEVEDESLTGDDIANTSLTGADIQNDSLSSADTDASVQSFCQEGAIRGHALVNGAAGFSATYTTTGVAESFNCAGGAVQARRTAAGIYNVCFPANFPFVAVVSGIGTGANSAGSDNLVTWRRVVDAACASNANTVVEVTIVDDGDGAAVTEEDASFSVALI